MNESGKKSSQITFSAQQGPLKNCFIFKTALQVQTLDKIVSCNSNFFT